jgi:hypothetical protein
MNYKVRAIVGLCLVLFSLKALAITIITESGGLVSGGTVSPDLTGKNLIANRIYTLTAKPRAGYTFDHWSVWDTYYETRHEYYSPKLSFTLLNGFVAIKDGTNYDFAGPINDYFTAYFVPKPIVPGTYISINTDTFTTYSRFRVSANGAFSAKAFFQGQWHSFSGKFVDRTAHSTLRVGTNKVGVTLYLDSEYVFIDSESDPYDPDSPINWLGATLVTPLHDPRTTTYYGGKYTVTIFGADNDALAPKGDGFARVSINRAGRLLAIGKLADGTPFTQSATFWSHGPDSYLEWPIFLLFGAGNEIFAGKVTFFGSHSFLAGDVAWEKGQHTSDLSYPEGFRRELGIIGSPYIPPKIRGRILDNPNLLISVDGGALPIHFSTTATLTSDNQIVANDPTNQIAITIQTDTGLFSGTAIPPGQSEPIEFHGALVQSMPSDSLLYEYYGSGFFLQNNLSGRIKVVARLPPLEMTIISNPTNLYAGYSGGFTGLISGNPSAYFWDFGDGTIVSNSVWAVHTWTQGGDFEVKLRAVDDANQGGVAATCLVHISVPTLQVSLNEKEVTLAPSEAHEIAAQITGVVDWYRWDISDGLSILGVPPTDPYATSYSHSWAGPGEFQVVLSGFNAYSGVISATSIVHVVEPPPIHTH